MSTPGIPATLGKHLTVPILIGLVLAPTPPLRREGKQGVSSAVYLHYCTLVLHHDLWCKYYYPSFKDRKIFGIK